MQQYADTEQLAVDEKKKRLHYERIRITEDREEIRQQKAEVEKQELEIDEKVYSDTKDQQAEKHRIDNLVDELDTEIEAIKNSLQMKLKEKEMYVLERGVYEK